MVDDYFLSLRMEVQEATLQHEIGHYVLGHMNQVATPKIIFDRYVLIGKIVTCDDEEQLNILVQHTLVTRNVDHEFEADAYAAEHATQNGILAMLVTMYAMTHSSELEARYEHIVGDSPEWSLKGLLKRCENHISLDDLE